MCVGTFPVIDRRRPLDRSRSRRLPSISLDALRSHYGLDEKQHGEVICRRLQSDRIVTTDELIGAAAAALRDKLSGCAAADRNGDGIVAIVKLIEAVNAALAGCR